jgi:hypothetical protein
MSKAEKTYSAQVNAHGVVIVCGDDVARNSYRVVFVGSYRACCDYKLAHSKY